MIEISQNAVVDKSNNLPQHEVLQPTALLEYNKGMHYTLLNFNILTKNNFFFHGVLGLIPA
jgi:hypothetical protein